MSIYLKGNLFIPAPHGQLEATYRPKNHEAERVALVLHPHPQFDGTMHNKVVFRTARALQASGYEPLRFNFRGVGQSSGVFDNGEGEMEDARIALEYLIADQPKAKEIIIAGFSFGSAVGIRVGCVDPRVNRLIAIGAPIKMYNRDFLLTCTKPKLFIHGEQDAIAPCSPIEELTSSLPPENKTQFVKIADAGHFFDEKLDELMRVIQEYVGNFQNEQSK